MDRNLSKLVMAVAVMGVTAGEAAAQTRWDDERANASADYRADTEGSANRMYENLRGMSDVPSRWLPYLRRVDLSQCEYNPRYRLRPAPTVAELTGTTQFDDRYSFSPRSDFLAREESTREYIRDIIADACAEVRDRGIELERELAQIAVYEAEARRRGQ